MTKKCDKKISVLLADASPSSRDVLKIVLEPYDQIHVVAEAEDALAAIKRIDEGFEGVVVIDISLLESDGIKKVLQIKRIRPAIQMVVLSFQSDIRYLQKSFKTGASGFVLKERAFEDLPEAIRRVANQTNFISIDVVP